MADIHIVESVRRGDKGGRSLTVVYHVPAPASYPGDPLFESVVPDLNPGDLLKLQDGTEYEVAEIIRYNVADTALIDDAVLQERWHDVAAESTTRLQDRYNISKTLDRSTR